ncbi:MAG: response regulator transcription factor [Tannerella sp.]|jgi:DNA-binding NarL/FixJ family response regulator|nr:response regulator transcription factor [Tannerella sp.]
MIKVHIADHHKMLTGAIHSLIDKSKYAVVTGISETLTDCRKALDRQQTDVLLIELRQLTRPDTPKEYPYNGVDFCKDMKQDHPHIKIVALTDYNSWIIIRRMLDSGISGYVLKTSPLLEVLNAIDNVMDGDIYLCPKSSRQLRKEMDNVFFWVTIEEQKLLRHISEGYTNKEIAAKMGPTLETIKSNRKLLKDKFESVGKSTIDMLKKAAQMGLIWEDLI